MIRSVVVVAALGMALGMSACGGAEEGSPHGQTTDASATSSEAGAGDPISDGAFEPLGADLSPEEMVQAFYDQLNIMYNSGVVEADADSDERFASVDDETFVSEKIASIREAFIAAHFDPAWQRNTNLSEYIGSLNDVHVFTQWMKLITFGDEKENLEPYQAGSSVQDIEAITVTDTERSVYVEWVGYDNRDKNRVSELAEGDRNEFEGRSTKTWRLVNNEWKLTDIVHDDG